MCVCGNIVYLTLGLFDHILDEKSVEAYSSPALVWECGNFLKSNSICLNRWDIHYSMVSFGIIWFLIIFIKATNKL